jgi:hypothetical protein
MSLLGLQLLPLDLPLPLPVPPAPALLQHLLPALRSFLLPVIHPLPACQGQLHQRYWRVTQLLVRSIEHEYCSVMANKK